MFRRTRAVSSTHGALFPSPLCLLMVCETSCYGFYTGGKMALRSNSHFGTLTSRRTTVAQRDALILWMTEVRRLLMAPEMLSTSEWNDWSVCDFDRILEWLQLRHTGHWTHLWETSERYHPACHSDYPSWHWPLPHRLSEIWCVQVLYVLWLVDHKDEPRGYHFVLGNKCFGVFGDDKPLNWSSAQQECRSKEIGRASCRERV